MSVRLRKGAKRSKPPVNQPPPPMTRSRSKQALMSVGVPRPPYRSARTQPQKRSLRHALLYVLQIKETFNRQPRVYKKFMDTIKKCNQKILDCHEMVNRVLNLFDGHPELIVCFSKFLSPGWEIGVKSDGQITIIFC